ncbi:U4/U6.U5 tri-snrnp-associated protein 2 [Phtheirospermum japonicum]|uniref:U4/U6.U5 tri-snrnp-associated protein 2 n=1 Tax=Phtheirospermum japonicum TaxID=374723 RepID=A0A830B479_9LAMI|nr:U4/U6.U5 tri-snrnp-associated protein 2 [Phtheirospermum japonicum]
MKTKPEQSLDGDAKRQKLTELFASYNDDEEEEVNVRDGGGGTIINNGGMAEINHHELQQEDDDDEEEEDRVGQWRRGRAIEVRRDCPYLDTVNRQVLDFDFEKFCSVSLSNLNVYACLVCGKYYQGRGHKSHAYTHSLEAGHHVYINLQTEKVYCLPDGYEVSDPSLDDIRHVLNPRHMHLLMFPANYRFSRGQVGQIDQNRQWSRSLDGSDYFPGMVGLNNIKETDFVNVTIQSLMRVTPYRNFFLIPENYANCKSQLVLRYGELTRKIWLARNFKGQVSPHEFLQAGELEVAKEIHSKYIGEKNENGDGGTEVGKVIMETSKMPFLMLGLDLPPPPLFKDIMEKNIIPQVPLFNIMKKFDGETVTEVVRPLIARMRYRVTKLPQYLILHMRRFTKNNFFVEKNPTLVNFPVKNLELKDYIPLPVRNENEKMRSKYDLIANIVHDGKPGEGSYRVFVQRKSEELWYEMQDLHVSETLPQMVALSEAYMQIYEQQQ